MLRCLLWVLAAAVQPKALLIADNLCLRQQLVVLQRRKPRPHLEDVDRRFWILACRWFSGWQTSLLVVRPETVLRWHRQGWRMYWRRRSRRAARPPPNCAGAADLDPPNDHGEPTLGPAEDPGGAGEAWVQSFSQNGRQVYATNPSSWAVHHLAVAPEAARLGDLGVRLLLHPNDHVQNALRVLRDRSPKMSSARATKYPPRITQRSRILYAGFPAGSTMWPLAVFETRWSMAISTPGIFAAMGRP
jgi:hypothetical protein